MSAIERARAVERTRVLGETANVTTLPSSARSTICVGVDRLDDAAVASLALDARRAPAAGSASASTAATTVRRRSDADRHGSIVAPHGKPVVVRA